MARRFRRAFRRGGKVAKQQLGWSYGAFGTTIDITGNPPDMTTQVLFDPINDIHGSSAGTDFTRNYSIKRIIVKGGVLWTPQAVAVATERSVMTYACYTGDREETDVQLVSSAEGSILEGGAGRLLWWDAIPFQITEVAPPDKVSNVDYENFLRVDLDLKLNVKLRGNDELIYFSQQLANDLSGTTTGMLMAISTRVLFVY